MRNNPPNTALNPITSLVNRGLNSTLTIDLLLENIRNPVAAAAKNTLESKEHITVTKGYSHIKELLDIAENSIERHITVVTRNSKIRDAAHIILAAYNTNLQSKSRELKLNITYGTYFPKNTENDTEYIFFDIPNFGKSNNSEDERELINFLKENGIQYSFTFFSDKYRNNPYLQELLDGKTVSEKRGDSLKSMHESHTHGTIEARDLGNTNGAFRNKEEEQEHAESNMINALISNTNNSPTICVARDHKQSVDIGGRLEKSVIVNYENMEDFLLYPDNFDKYDYIIITKQIVGYLNFEEIASVNLAFFYYASLDKLRKLTKQAIHHKRGATVIIYNYLYEKWGYDQDNLLQVGKKNIRKTSRKKRNLEIAEEKRDITAPTIVSTETRLGLTDEADLKRYDADLLEQKVIDDVIGLRDTDIKFEIFASKYEEIKNNIYLVELFSRKKPNGKKTVSFRSYLQYFIEVGVIKTPSKIEICEGIKGEGQALGIHELSGFLGTNIIKRNKEGISLLSLTSAPYFNLYLVEKDLQISTLTLKDKIELIEYLFDNYKEQIHAGAIHELHSIGIPNFNELLLHTYLFDYNGRSHTKIHIGDDSLMNAISSCPYLSHLCKLQTKAGIKFNRSNIIGLTNILFPNVENLIQKSLQFQVKNELSFIEDDMTVDAFITKYWTEEYGYFKLLINLGHNGEYPGLPNFSSNRKSQFKLEDLTLLKKFLKLEITEDSSRN